MINLNCIIMGCHTWGYVKVKSMKQKDFDKVKAHCDECADKVLTDTTPPEWYLGMLNRYENIVTLEQVKENIKRTKEKARYYKEHIDKDRTAVRCYTNNREIDGEIYVNYEKNLDAYIRVDDYPEGIFRSAQEVIDMCEENDWKSAYWFDDKSGKVNAQDNISEAKERIKRMFEDNPDTVVEFG